ncbi:MAG TPA: flagellar motor protein MotB [Candidatus Binatia bacterium]|jgi:chemotaxis protein MotB|nr:flagellar motor protein MotB [Candidatus Binatia bacterium]
MGDEPRVRIIKKKGGHAAHHGGAWKVAYADFVTAMMALFMVLWLLTQADLKLRQNIAQYFRSPGVLQGGAVITEEHNEAKSREPKVVSLEVTIIQGDAEEQLLQNQAKEVEEAIKRGAEEDPALAELKEQVIVQVTDAGLSIQVVDKSKLMLFDLSSSDLKPQVVELLKRVGGILGHMPNPIMVGGHTDSRPYPPQTVMTNWELAFRRADNARRILESNGLRPGQVKQVLSFADSQPIVMDNPLADENRRLSILAQRQAPPPPVPGTPNDEPPPIILPPDPIPGHPPAV